MYFPPPARIHPTLLKNVQIDSWSRSTKHFKCVCSARIFLGVLSLPFQVALPTLRLPDILLPGSQIRTVPACGVAPPTGGVTGDVDADFHHHLRFHERDVQRLAPAPPGGERPACPGVAAPARSEQAGDRDARRPGQSGGAAGVLQAAVIVVPAE
jgi:hypothetical protein